MLDEIFEGQDTLYSESLVDQIFEIVEKRIIEGKLKPRSPISEDRLASIFGTSRSPVREAILRLENVGLVVRTENNRKIVAPFSAEEAREYYQMWEMVESYLGGLACEIATDKTYLQIESVLRDMDEITASDRDNLKRYRLLNYEFHALFVEESPNQSLLQVYERAVKSIQWCWNLSLHHRDDIVRSNAEHKDLYRIFKQRDRTGFESQIRQHITAAAARFIKEFRQ